MEQEYTTDAQNVWSAFLDGFDVVTDISAFVGAKGVRIAKRALCTATLPTADKILPYVDMHSKDDDCASQAPKRWLARYLSDNPKLVQAFLFYIFGCSLT